MQILSNLLLLVVGSLLLGLQRLLYGPLRPIEVEQLYEKAWFAVTETCLAMTIFRDEVGAWFVVMFVSLLVGKVWGWIGEGRVEVLEQQPPENPRLFHARLTASLAASLLFDAYLLKYSVSTVQQQARPNMMVMFAFEFAVLTVSSASTCLRYAISLREAAIIKEQTTARLEERRREIVRHREAAARSAAEAGEDPPEEVPIDEVLDEADIDAPGWEEKSRWVFYLDLATGSYRVAPVYGKYANQIADFVKLFLYLTFFCVLCMFYGMPIHIIRDVALTIRSFYKRITDFLKYRHATRDMNDRYLDATEEDIRSQDVCIICREGMRAWQQPGAEEEHAEGPLSPADGRLRPKKLPCGHILHFACLRSWLERQQNCPTCRQPVLTSSPQSPAVPRAPEQWRAGQGQGAAPERPGMNDNQHHADQNRVRFFNLGPIRLGFGAGHDLRGLEQQFNNQQVQQGNAGNNGNVHQFGFSLGMGRPQRHTGAPGQSTSPNLQSQLQTIEQQLMRDIQNLRLQNEQLHVVRALQGELARLRIAYANNTGPHIEIQGGAGQLQSQQQQQHILSTFAQQPHAAMSALGANASSQAMSAGNPNMPPGITIPEGWTLLPLQPLSDLQGSPAPLQNNNSGDNRSSVSTAPTAGVPRAVAPQPDAMATSSVSSETAPATNTTTNSDAHVRDLTSHHPRPTENPHPPGDEGSAENAPQWSFHSEPQPSSLVNTGSSQTRRSDTNTGGTKDDFLKRRNSEGKDKGKATTVEDAEESDENS